jgi:hypothetical protein
MKQQKMWLMSKTSKTTVIARECNDRSNPGTLHSAKLSDCLKAPYVLVGTFPVIPAKAGIHKGVKWLLQALLWILPFLLLPLPVGCSCFPDQSQAIGKMREVDKKTGELQAAYKEHLKPAYQWLRDLQDKVPTLEQDKIFQGNERDNIKKTLNSLFRPLFIDEQALNEHLAKHAKDSFEKEKRQKRARGVDYYISGLPDWVQKNVDEGMYKALLYFAQAAQEEALRDALAELQKKFPSPDKERELDKAKILQGTEVKELLGKRYLPFQYAMQAHGIFWKQEFSGKADRARQSIEKVGAWLNNSNTNKEEMYGLVDKLWITVKDGLSLEKVAP